MWEKQRSRALNELYVEFRITFEILLKEEIQTLGWVDQVNSRVRVFTMALDVEFMISGRMSS